MKQDSRNRTMELSVVALMAAVTAVMAQIAIPMPAGVPMTMQTFAVTLAGVILGAKLGGLSILIYVTLGTVGIPVFANMTGGLSFLIGPTGGFLISFPLMAFIIGIGVKYIDNKKWLFWAYLVAGTLINYVIGTIMFSISTGSGLVASIMACVVPFIPTAIVKAVLGAVLGIQIRKALLRTQVGLVLR